MGLETEGGLWTVKSGARRALRRGSISVPNLRECTLIHEWWNWQKIISEYESLPDQPDPFSRILDGVDLNGSSSSGCVRTRPSGSGAVWMCSLFGNAPSVDPEYWARSESTCKRGPLLCTACPNSLRMEEFFTFTRLTFQTFHCVLSSFHTVNTKIWDRQQCTNYSFSRG